MSNLPLLRGLYQRSIILIIDQSNSTGQSAGHVYANLNSIYKPLMYKSYSAYNDGGMYIYRAGYNSHFFDAGGNSFEWTASFVYKMINTYKKTPYIVNCSYGNTSLYSPAIGTHTWDYNTLGNLYTSSMNSYYYPALNNCLAEKQTVCVLGLCENDATDLSAANAHYANKKALIAKLRSSVVNGGTGDPNLKIVLLLPKIELEPGTHPYTQTVINAVNKIASEDPNTIIFDESVLNLQPDLIHWTDDSTQTAGLLLADLINNIVQY